jgi:FAD/FMN-containing dehydrogenase
VIVPGDPEYEQARLVWNAIADRRPATIVRCASVDDVVTAIHHAREHELVVAVRGGGHSVAGFSTCDGGMVIDLSRMRRVQIDPVRRRAWTDGGAHLSQLDAAAQKHGLVCPVGVIGHTGVAGLTLGGGMGRLHRKFGLTVDNVVGIDLITAAGDRVHAGDEENPELFWGMRGAGANFGVVTSFEFRLHDMDPTIFQGGVAYPLERAPDVVGRVRELLASHADVAISVAFGKDEQHHPVLAIGSTHTGGIEQAEKDLRVLRGKGSLADTFGPKSYVAVQTANDEAAGWGNRFYSKSGFLPELTDEAVEKCMSLCETAPPGGELSLWAHGGAVGRVDDAAMAYTGREAAFSIHAELFWTDPADDQDRVSWGRQAIAALKPYMSTGRYVNDVAEHGTDGAQIYGAAKYERLVALKRKYDPDNFFRLNQNIRP